MTWIAAIAWATGLDVNGSQGCVCRDGPGDPVSEMGHMFYVTLGNLGFCPPDGGDGDPATCDGAPQSGCGLSNTGPFDNVQSFNYWSGTALSSSNAWVFNFDDGFQPLNGKSNDLFVWAVRPGDVSAVPIPAAVWLFGSGLIGLLGLAKRKR